MARIKKQSAGNGTTAKASASRDPKAPEAAVAHKPAFLLKWWAPPVPSSWWAAPVPLPSRSSWSTN